MTAKEYLSQARNIYLKLKSMGDQLRSLRDAAENISPMMSSMPRPATRNIHRTEDAIVRILDLENAMYNEFDKLAAIHKTIYVVSDPVRQAILVKRYIKGDSGGSIAIELDISLRRV